MDINKEVQYIIDVIINIDDRAYSMQYYNQRLRPARDCRRIEIARENQKRRCILQSFERICREQRKADLDFIEPIGIPEIKILIEAIKFNLDSSPLLTDNK